MATFTVAQRVASKLICHSMCASAEFHDLGAAGVGGQNVENVAWFVDSAGLDVVDGGEHLKKGGGDRCAGFGAFWLVIALRKGLGVMFPSEMRFISACSSRKGGELLTFERC